MFTWICPQCGREVPPSYNDCPNCAPGQQAGAPAQPPPPPVAPPPQSYAAPPPQQGYAAPPPPYPQQPPAYAPPPPPPQGYAPPPPPPNYYAPPPPPPQQNYAPPAPAYAPPAPVQPTQELYEPAASSISTLFASAAPASSSTSAQPFEQPARSGMPTWLMSIVFTLAFLGLGASIYWLVQRMQGGGSQTTSTSAAAADSGAKGQAGAAVSAMQKYVELVGVRLVQNSKKQTEARFVLINHSPAEAADLAGTVAILGRTQKEGDEPVGRFTFKGISLGPYESKEGVAPVDTKLRVYELPDWQMTVAQLQLTSP